MFAAMTTPPPVPDGPAADGCADLRATVASSCDEAHRALATHEAAKRHTRDLRRDLVAAQHKQAEALVAADPRTRSEEKALARAEYQRAREAAETDAQLSEATADWARALDHVNRTGRLAARAVTKANEVVGRLEAALREAERDEQTARIRAEQAEAACLDARVRLASCEEESQAPEPGEPATALKPHAGTGGHATAISETRVGGPLVIESMVSGDRRALELAAAAIADHVGVTPAEAQLQLSELVDAIVSAASEDGHLVFDTRHSFWSGLSFEEARDVIAALARLGFTLEPAEGWHSGRAPSPADLSMALAYAGLDPRNMRDLPTVDDLLVLPQSIGVDARAFLAARAPELTVDTMVHILGRRATQLEPLWDEWGQVRPILLSDRHALGSVPG